jgi:hypothetical protein
MNRLLFAILGLIFALVLTTGCQPLGFSGSLTKFPGWQNFWWSLAVENESNQGDMEMGALSGYTATYVYTSDGVEGHCPGVSYKEAGNRDNWQAVNGYMYINRLWASPWTFTQPYETGRYNHQMRANPDGELRLDMVCADSNGDGVCVPDFYGDVYLHGMTSGIAYTPCYYGFGGPSATPPAGFDPVTYIYEDWYTRQGIEYAGMQPGHDRGGVHNNGLDGSGVGSAGTISNLSLDTVVQVMQTIQPADIQVRAFKEYADVQITGVAIGNDVYRLSTPADVQIGISERTLAWGMTPDLRRAYLWLASKVERLPSLDGVLPTLYVNGVPVTPAQNELAEMSFGDDPARTAENLRSVVVKAYDRTSLMRARRR